MKDKLYKYKTIRIGSKFDGGYFVCPYSISNTNNLISLGIETNWEFEKEFMKTNPKIITNCYDGQTNYKLILKFFLIQVIKALLLELNTSLLKRSFYNLFEYSFLLKKKLNFKRKNIGLKNGLTFKEIVSNKKDVFLKIDIEGSEYRILDEILEFKNKLVGLVIEFHDYDLNKKKVKKFIQELGLVLVYININEMGGTSIDNYPLVLELSFSKNPTESKVNDQISKTPNSKKNKFISLDDVKI